MQQQQSQADRERRLLAEGREKILGIAITAEKTGSVNKLPYMHLLASRFLLPLAAEIKAGETGSKAGAHKKYTAYLGSLDANLIALRAIQTVVSVLGAEGALDSPSPIHKKVAYAVGRGVYYEYLMQHFADLSPPLFNTLLREFSRSMASDEQFLMRQFRQRFQTEGYKFPTWEFGDTEQVGNFLLGRLQALAFIEVWNRTEKQARGVKVVKYICLQEDVRSMALDLVDHVADLPRATGPMVEAPLHWDAQTNTGGGFHTDGMQKLCAYAVQGKGLGPVAESTVEALNNLQAQRWQINEPLLSIVERAAALFDFGDVVSSNMRPKPEFPEGGTDEQKALWKGTVKHWYTERKVRAVHHLRCRKALTEARQLADLNDIWFTYYADFRGRLYARASGVSPQGTDLEKGLLRFSLGKPLPTDEAVAWFKIHGANKFGIDKVSFEARLKWVADKHDDIIAAAADPLSVRWWADADCPVQFLAWVLEYAERERYGKAFVSYLPVSLDGTCNGLQNFSALLRDSVGGLEVNLSPGDHPRDIYAAVAARTTELLQQMPSSRLRDAWLRHGINRKITKRTTMTLDYRRGR